MSSDVTPINIIINIMLSHKHDKCPECSEVVTTDNRDMGMKHQGINEVSRYDEGYLVVVWHHLMLLDTLTFTQQPIISDFVC